MSWQRTHADPRLFAKCQHAGTPRCVWCGAYDEPPYVQPASPRTNGGVPLGQAQPVMKSAMPPLVSERRKEQWRVASAQHYARKRAA